MSNLFDNLPELTERVIVAGAGATLGAALKALPCAFRGVSVIACNYAICAPWPDPERVWWLCDDGNACMTDWFELAIASAAPDRTILSRELAANHYRPSPRPAGLLIYESGPSLNAKGFKLGAMPGVLRGGGTVSAKAAQLVYWCGARHISYAGVEMRGNAYWDGTTQPRYHGDHWRSRRETLDRLNRWLAEHGIAVDSLTATALEVGGA